MHWLGRHRLLILAAISPFWTGLVLLLHFYPDVPFVSAVWSGEKRFEDFLQREGRKTPTRDDFVFLGIDQSTLQLPPFEPGELASNRALQLMRERPFPWSREVWALLLDRLFASGARLVMFDLIFNPPNDGDPAFHAALDRYRGKVVVGANFDSAKTMQAIVPNDVLIPPPQMHDPRVGYVNFFPDPLDQRVRAIPYTMTDRQTRRPPRHPSEEVFYSFAARGLEQIGRGADVPRDHEARLIRFSSERGLSATAALRSFRSEILARELRRRRFFQGQDRRRRSLRAGPARRRRHTDSARIARARSCISKRWRRRMAHQFLRMTPLRVDLLLVAAAGLFAWLLIAFVRRPLTALLLLTRDRRRSTWPRRESPTIRRGCSSSRCRC